MKFLEAHILISMDNVRIRHPIESAGVSRSSCEPSSPSRSRELVAHDDQFLPEQNLNSRLFLISSFSPFSILWSFGEAILGSSFVKTRVANNTCGILHSSKENIMAKIIRWWLIKPVNKVHELLLQSLSSIIYWGTSKYRSNFKHEGVRISIPRIINQISNLLYLIINSQFLELPLSLSIIS
ncbi:hypothetical protein H5410_014208 [Solanum commersonii]|uniref:Uncharacterized protein n=1 Tax=Solanum commersonii TaxID=4109 RepID=A0A9J5ZQC5_SOLCO|nr:hypothetical protein H5410_014208 [Solanum commersonii]